MQQEEGAPPIVAIENNNVQDTTTFINTMRMGTSQAQEEAKDEHENGSDSNLNRVTIPHRQDDLYMIGEETEHELSLSREDDSDLRITRRIKSKSKDVMTTIHSRLSQASWKRVFSMKTTCVARSTPKSPTFLKDVTRKT